MESYFLENQGGKFIPKVASSKLAQEAFRFELFHQLI